MYKYLLFRTWIDEEGQPRAEQVHSSNNFHGVLSWGTASGRGNDDVYIVIDQSHVLGFRQALH